MCMKGVCIHLDVRYSYGGQAVPGLFHFTLVAAEKCAARRAERAKERLSNLNPLPYCPNAVLLRAWS